MALTKLNTRSLADASVTSAKISLGDTARRQIFTSSGTFTVPTGVTQIWVSLCGGGGDGQNQGANESGGGGAGGMYIPRTVTAGTAITVTIGAGGSGTFGGGAHGVDGNDTSFGTSGQGWYLLAKGGDGSGTQYGGAQYESEAAGYSTTRPISGGGRGIPHKSGGSVFGEGNKSGSSGTYWMGYGVGGAGGQSGHNGQGGSSGMVVVEW